MSQMKYETFKNGERVDAGEVTFETYPALGQAITGRLCVLARQFGFDQKVFEKRDVEEFAFMEAVQGSFERAVVRLGAGASIKINDDEFIVEIKGG